MCTLKAVNFQINRFLGIRVNASYAIDNAYKYLVAKLRNINRPGALYVHQWPMVIFVSVMILGWGIEN
jgi:hypothetical protein